ncbi:MAG: hypothetical protein ACE5IP_01835 [Terriglobia bacterium]
MRRIVVFLVVVSVLLLGVSVSAQELPKAEKRENVQYYQAMFIKFKPGMADQAWEAIYQHFINVDKKIGRKVRAYDLQTGGWDIVVFFPIEGPDYYSWSTPPQDEEWWAAFAELEGGAEKAQEIFSKFLKTVADSKVELAHRHLEIDQE